MEGKFPKELPVFPCGGFDEHARVRAIFLILHRRRITPTTTKTQRRGRVKAGVEKYIVRSKADVMRQRAAAADARTDDRSCARSANGDFLSEDKSIPRINPFTEPCARAR